MGSRAVIDVDSVILSKCHSGESLFEYYLQEFQYGKDVFQTTTNMYRQTSARMYKGIVEMFGYGNIE